MRRCENGTERGLEWARGRLGDGGGLLVRMEWYSIMYW